MSSAQDYQSPACSGIFQEQNEGPPTQPCLNGNVTEQKDESVNIQKKTQRKWQQLNCSFHKKHTRWVDITYEKSAAKGITGWRKFPNTSEPFSLQIQKRCQTRKHKPRRANNATNFCKPSKDKVEDRTSAQKNKMEFLQEETQH